MGNTNEIIIDDGKKEYVFKNSFGEVFATFRYNATDTGILERYKKVSEFFSNMQIDETNEDVIVQLDNAIKEQFDFLCNSNVSDGIFKEYNPLTLFANGDFYCEIALTQIGNFIESELNVRIDKKKAKMRKVLAQKRK